MWRRRDVDARNLADFMNGSRPSTTTTESRGGGLEGHGTVGKGRAQRKRERDQTSCRAQEQAALVAFLQTRIAVLTLSQPRRAYTRTNAQKRSKSKALG